DSIISEPEKLESIAQRSDEIGEFAAVFKEMSQEIFAREQSLKGKVEELRQETDQAKKAALASQLSGNVDVNTLLLRSQQARQKLVD
ncbi:MAG: histidine kinase, partial [Cyanobacteria bacterium J06643_5]